MSRSFILKVMTLSLLVMLPSTESALAGRDTDTLEVAFPRDVTTVDGMYTSRRENDILGLLTDDALFYVDPNQLKTVPLAAESYDLIDDMTLNITIRDDVYFHDGSLMTVDDVIYSLNWAKNPKSKSRQRLRLAGWIESVRKTGPYQFQLKMSHPYPLALYDLSYYVKMRKSGYYERAKDAPGPILNGTGPYKIVEFEPARTLILTQFDKYRVGGPKGTPEIKNISIRAISDWATQAAEILSGGIQWTFQMPTDIAEDLGSDPRARLITGPSLRVGFLTMDVVGKTESGSPLQHLKVRQAINHAIDRQAIVDHLIRGSSKVVYSACHPFQFGCITDVVKYDYDPEKAKRLLAEAGYPDGFTIPLWAARERPVMEVIQHQLSKVGITVDLRFVMGSALGRALKRGQLSMFYNTWGSFSIPDAGAIGPEHWSMASFRNLSGDEVVSKAMDRANSSYDKEVRMTAFNNAFKRIAEQAYWVPMFGYTMNYVVTPDVDYTPSKDGMQRLFEVKWKDPQ